MSKRGLNSSSPLRIPPLLHGDEGMEEDGEESAEQRSNGWKRTEVEPARGAWPGDGAEKRGGSRRQAIRGLNASVDLRIRHRRARSPGGVATSPTPLAAAVKKNAARRAATANLLFTHSWRSASKNSAGVEAKRNQAGHPFRGSCDGHSRARRDEGPGAPAAGNNSSGRAPSHRRRRDRSRPAIRQLAAVQPAGRRATINLVA
ncbi:hypothetical protein HPB50_012589 [Hyalomma asiaticum]|uniref:Uncharacterized protein n=1 Tax=Hyalomma asiaticum TaxID=266040 RepID=A0ACB7S004_HYAAI|nr:hypothetical protein HPB50_012589 [Hyalomma asiaticum]